MSELTGLGLSSRCQKFTNGTELGCELTEKAYDANSSGNGG